MALTPLKVGRGEGGGLYEREIKAADYGFNSASSRCRVGRQGSWRRLDSTAARSGSGDAGGGR
jgi:hypothetical protein